MSKLELEQKHILKLIYEGRGDDGWADVNHRMCEKIRANMPSELVEFERDWSKEFARARLTANGEKVAYALQWIG